MAAKPPTKAKASRAAIVAIRVTSGGMGGSAAFRDVAGWCAGALTTTLPRADTPSF
jgi:hypothetical protein